MRITVNGRMRLTGGEHLSHVALVRMAFPDTLTPIGFTVTWRGGGTGGTVAYGDLVLVEEYMEFTVTRERGV